MLLWTRHEIPAARPTPRATCGTVRGRGWPIAHKKNIYLPPRCYHVRYWARQVPGHGIASACDFTTRRNVSTSRVLLEHVREVDSLLHPPEIWHPHLHKSGTRKYISIWHQRRVLLEHVREVDSFTHPKSGTRKLDDSRYIFGMWSIYRADYAPPYFL